MAADGQKFCLHWNQFDKNLNQSLKNLRDNKLLLDVTLISDDRVQFQAHRIILAASSSFFSGIFEDQHQSNQNISHPWLFLKGVKSSYLESLLQYLYEGEVNITQEELSDFLAVSEDLQVMSSSQYIFCESEFIIW